MFENIFGNNVVRKVEKQKRVDGQIEVLKKQQKVEYENVVNDYNNKKNLLINTTKSQIETMKTQITYLNANKEASLKLLDEQKKVALDKVLNEYDGKIIAKQNLSKKLGYYIEAEQKNLQDVIQPDKPNAPKKTLLEDVKKK